MENTKMNFGNLAKSIRRRTKTLTNNSNNNDNNVAEKTWKFGKTKDRVFGGSLPVSTVNLNRGITPLSSRTNRHSEGFNSMAVPILKSKSSSPSIHTLSPIYTLPLPTPTPSHVYLTIPTKPAATEDGWILIPTPTLNSYISQTATIWAASTLNLVVGPPEGGGERRSEESSTACASSSGVGSAEGRVSYDSCRTEISSANTRKSFPSPFSSTSTATDQLIEDLRRQLSSEKFSHSQTLSALHQREAEIQALIQIIISLSASSPRGAASSAKEKKDESIQVSPSPQPPTDSTLEAYISSLTRTIEIEYESKVSVLSRELDRAYALLSSLSSPSPSSFASSNVGVGIAGGRAGKRLSGAGLLVGLGSQPRRGVYGGFPKRNSPPGKQRIVSSPAITMSSAVGRSREPSVSPLPSRTPPRPSSVTPSTTPTPTRSSSPAPAPTTPTPTPSKQRPRPLLPRSSTLPVAAIPSLPPLPQSPTSPTSPTTPTPSPPHSPNPNSKLVMTHVDRFKRVHGSE